ncbi:MAG TPA: 2-hydroxyhepta-2,4-diene-1,7-dioate isomerase, partial [Chryseolinea sp.]|nr:2-hydroxyhepta-2,4-diene-1,7-dioate isomerase [Chryseolinea sp.]
MKIFKTNSGIVIQHEDQYFLSKESNWDKFVNRSKLHQHIITEIVNLKPNATLLQSINSNLKAPIGNQEIWA